MKICDHSTRHILSQSATPTFIEVTLEVILFHLSILQHALLSLQKTDDARQSVFVLFFSGQAQLRLILQEARDEN